MKNNIPQMHTIIRVIPENATMRTLVFDCSYDVARGRLRASGRKLDRFEREVQHLALRRDRS